jgi:CDP-2,3-bis-(O-geranylgeranyl)-sn-glycerol synthase|tara:strand:+ start:91 stop:600 length:510 start_codon:yes stop_codon:yes gene_type:complete
MIIEVFFLLLPAALGNMVLSIFKKFRFFNTPVDFGSSFRGKRVFGDNKTWKGLVVGTLVAVLVVYLERMMGVFPGYEEYGFVVLGLVLGLGSLLGDLVESFVKRQFGRAPGTSWMPWDQIDWILGSLLLLSLLEPVGIGYWMYGILIYGALHIVTNLIGYYCGVNKGKF